MTITTLRNGPTPVGESEARALAIVDAPFLSSITPTADTFKRDQFTDVVRKDELLPKDGFYSLGSVGGQYHIMGALSVYQTFRDRGIYDTMSGLLIPAIIQFGKGWGWTAWTQESDIPGVYKSQCYKTRNGRALHEMALMIYQGSGRSYEPSPGVSGYGEEATIIPSGIAMGTTSRWNSGRFATESSQEIFDLGAPYHFPSVAHNYTIDSGVSMSRNYFTIAEPNYVGLGKSFVIGHSTRIMLIPGYRLANTGSPSYPGGVPADVTATKLHVSYNAGASWADMADGTNFLTGLYGTGASAAPYNATLAHLLDQTEMVPVSSSQYLMAHFFTPDASPSAKELRFYRGTIGSAPTQVASITPTETVTNYSTIKLFSNGTKTFAFLSMAGDFNQYYVSLDKGSTWAGPFAMVMSPGASAVGLIDANDKTSFVIPGYSGSAYWAYVAKVTNTAPYLTSFVARAKIRAAPPPSGSPMPFSSIAQLRIGDRPAPNMPFAPWVGDYRITPPAGW